MEQENNQIQIYQSTDGEIRLDVKTDGETVWLTQNQMAVLFGVDRTSILRHIRNIYKSEELEESSTCAKNAQVRIEGTREIVREIPFYNLDMIISVGYRVNSQRATSFRKWATTVLKEYILKGYAINDRMKLERYEELKNVVRLMARTMETPQLLPNDEAKSIFAMVKDYVYALDTLARYDYQQLSIEATTTTERFHATYENAMEVIRGLHEKLGGSALFSNEKDGSFHSSIGQIYQTFGGVDLYPSVEEKAAMLLYLVSKNHSFSDGNKRIAATLFLWFL